MIRALLVGCLLLLAGCASQAPLPAKTPSLALPLQLHIEREQAAMVSLQGLNNPALLRVQALDLPGVQLVDRLGDRKSVV